MISELRGATAQENPGAPLLRYSYQELGGLVHSTQWTPPKLHLNQPTFGIDRKKKGDNHLQTCELVRSYTLATNMNNLL